MAFLNLDLTLGLIRVAHKFHVSIPKRLNIYSSEGPGAITISLSPPTITWRPYEKGKEFMPTRQNPHSRWMKLISKRQLISMNSYRIVKRPLPNLEVSRCQRWKISKARTNLITLHTVLQVDHDHQRETNPTTWGPSDEVMFPERLTARWKSSVPFYDVLRG